MMQDGGRSSHLLEYWSVLRRRRWVVYLALASVTVAAAVGSFLVTPQYRATSTLQIERHNPDILSFKDLARMDYSFAAYTDYYQTQYKLLQSDAVARATAERLGLATHPDFTAASAPSAWARLRALLPGAAPGPAADPVELAARRVQASLQVAPVRNSHLVLVSWVSPDPALAADVANAVADAYIQFNLKSQFSTTEQASEFLADQIGNLKREIADHEAQLQDYGESKRIVSIDDASNVTLKGLTEIGRERTQAQTALARAEAAYRAVAASRAEALPQVLDSPLIARLKEDYASYEALASEKGRVFKDDWPEMRQLRSKLEQARTRLDLEIQAIAGQVVASAEAEYRRAVEAVKSLDALQRQQEDLAQRLKRDAVEFNNLQSEAQKKRETLSSLMARQNEVTLSGRLKDLDTTSSNIRVVDRARPPAAPFKPNRRANLALGLVIGLLLGIGGAFFLDHLDSSVRTPEEIEKVAGLPVLTVIPRHGPTAAPLSRVRRRPAPAGEPVDLIAHRDGHAGASEAFRNLRTAILLSSAGSPPRQILVTSALPEEGKSATAVNLAVVLAQLGRRVLLVDTDLRRPRLHVVFEHDNARGLTTVLSGLEPDAARLVHATGVEGLALLASGPVPPNPSELLNAALFADLGKHFLAAGFDHVVYDAPPVLPVSDPVIAARVADAVLVVARSGRTPRPSLRAAAERLGQAGLRVVGVVLNDFDAAEHGYPPHHYYGVYASGDAGSGRAASRNRTGAA